MSKIVRKMAPKRTCKNIANNISYSDLNFKDVLCPICRSVLIEPVTLPCSHGFCSSCFEGTVANTNLVCPLCRVRIGSWLRKTSKKSLVNKGLWEAIRQQFPNEVKNKLEGNEDYVTEDAPRLLTTPGEIKREYEIEKAKEQRELQRLREAENKASEEYIQKLKEKEEYDACVKEENMRLSEKVAQKLSQEYTSDAGPSSSKSSANAKPYTVINNRHPTNKVRKQLSIDGLLKSMSEKKVKQPNNFKKEYTCKILCQNRDKANDRTSLLCLKDKLRRFIAESENSDNSNSNDSITSECRFFKPIDQRRIPLPVKVAIVKVPAIIANANTVIIGPPNGDIQFHHNCESPFAVVNVSTFTPKDVTRNLKDNTLLCNAVLSEILKPLKECPSGSTSKIVSPIAEHSYFKVYKTPSKRKPLRSSPSSTAVKRAKLDFKEAPFRGFDNSDLKVVKVNGAVNGLTKLNVDLKKVQEEEDFKLALKLQEEFNHLGRYSTRNSISLKPNSVSKKGRQIKLTEMMSQTSKVP